MKLIDKLGEMMFGFIIAAGISFFLMVVWMNSRCIRGGWDAGIW